MAGRHRGEPADVPGTMLAILDGLAAAVDASRARASEAGNGEAARAFHYTHAQLLSARADLLVALQWTNGENDGNDER